MTVWIRIAATSKTSLIVCLFNQRKWRPTKTHIIASIYLFTYLCERHINLSLRLVCLLTFLWIPVYINDVIVLMHTSGILCYRRLIIFMWWYCNFQRTVYDNECFPIYARLPRKAFFHKRTFFCIGYFVIKAYFTHSRSIVGFGRIFKKASQKNTQEL